MKLYYLLLVCLLSISICSHAQTALPEFAPHGATWTYESIDESTMPFAYYLDFMTVADNDTVVEGKTCKLFLMDGVPKFFAYRDSLQIWMHPDNLTQHWELLYDFGWTPGQVVNIPAGYGIDSIQFTVAGVTDTIINNDTLPMIKFQNFYSHSAIMNIGMTGNYFVPQYGYIPEVGPALLRCYSDTAIGSYKMPGVVVCDTNFHVSVPVLSTLNGLQLYPDPAMNEVYISGVNVNDIAVMQILSMDGRIMNTSFALTKSISLGGIPDGAYIVVFRFKNGNTVTRKLSVVR